MCIFYVNTKLDNFPLVLFDNRDEVFGRPTAPAEWWPEHPDIYAPRDLLKKEHGTWIGISRGGRIAVLVNKFSTPRDKERPPAKISRGALPKQFLLSNLAPSEWVKKKKQQNAEELGDCGGFSMFVAVVGRDHAETEILSNCDRNVALAAHEHIAMALSNGLYGDKTWSKVGEAESRFNSLLESKNFTPEVLLSRGFEILSTTSKPAPKLREELRNSIFIPPIELEHEKGIYGTRTQTAIIIDGLTAIYQEIDIATGKSKVERFALEI